MIRDDEIKRHGCSWLLSGWQLWKKKKAAEVFLSGMGWQTNAPETCQLRCRSTQRRPNSANHRHKFAVLSLTTRAEMEGWFQTWLQEGGAVAMVMAAELNLAVLGGVGWCLFFNLASTFFEIVEQKTPGSVLLRRAVHTALGLGPLKSPVLSDASESRPIIQSRYNYKRVHPGGSRSVSDTHTYSIHVCRAFASAPFMIAAKFVIVLIIKKHLSRSFCFRPAAWLKNAWYFSDKTVLLIHCKQWNLGVLLWKMFKTGGL